MSSNYNINAVRELLLAGFSAEELKRFCFDRPHFRPVYDEFSGGMGKAAVVDRILEFSQAKSLLPELLAEVKKLNPRQYANFEGRLLLPPEAAASPEVATGSAAPQAAPAPLEKRWLPFKLQLARLAGLEFEVRAVETPMGEPDGTGRLPFSPVELIQVLKALKAERYDPAAFSPEQVQTLEQLGLLRQQRFTADLHQRIGQMLYRALFPGDVDTAFKMAFNQARAQQSAVGLQLRLDAAAVELARYPWELLHDGNRALLSSGAVELTRYITYGEATTPLKVAPPWRMLIITARPANAAALPDQEARAVYDSLRAAIPEQDLIIDRLSPPTYDRLLDVLGAARYHLIHFDGHGLFARRCPNCNTMNYPHLAECDKCGDSLADVSPEGFLAFEDEQGQRDYVETRALENALSGYGVRLAVLSACESGTVRGDTLFGGVGPGLIRAGVPAVVAMQLPVRADSAINFARGFYTALTQGAPIPLAVAQGRRRLYRDRAYFIPTLYLRSSDDEGRLFMMKREA